MNTKEKIIHTSISLFNENGERAITTNHIASSLGMSPGNLYYHFKNKEDIIRHIFALYRDHLSTHFKPIDKAIYNSDILKSLTALNIAVENSVRECPEQYMWGYKRFRKRPIGDKKLYKDLR